MNVELIAYTPNPDAVCNLSAGTCVSEDIPVMETSVNKYRALKGALKSGHESVVEHVSFTFAVSGISRALSHQLVRHRLASYSQQSQRYVNMGEFEYVMPESIQTSKEKIYVGMELDCFECLTPDYEIVHKAYEELMCKIRETYENLIRVGIPEEDARYILPNACTTNIIVTMNARELRHFFKLRCCTRAQWEIRELANRMLELVKEVAPTIFANAGASCVATGRCPEGKKSCGKVKKCQKESD